MQSHLITIPVDNLFELLNLTKRSLPFIFERFDLLKHYKLSPV
jgi:hypothetical protein